MLRPEVRLSFEESTIGLSLMLRCRQTIESIYIMWRTTGDVRWRERGYRIFRALEKEAKTPSGYAALSSVEMSGGAKKDEMPRYVRRTVFAYVIAATHRIAVPSYFLAETYVLARCRVPFNITNPRSGHC